MLARLLGLPHGFDLLEGDVHVMDNPHVHELEIPCAHVGPFIHGSSCDPPPSRKCCQSFMHQPNIIFIKLGTF
jgi:hypothetical protein